MSHEIKFRAKRLDNDKWVYGSLIQYKHVTPDIYSTETYEFIAVDVETIGQYTCLKDKNGVEIYESDILRLAVEFDEEEVREVEYAHNGYWLRGWDGNEFGFPDGSDLEVIGNIYENPELLEQSK